MMSGAPLMYGLELAGPYMACWWAAGWALVGWDLLRLHNWARAWPRCGRHAIGIAWLVPSSLRGAEICAGRCCGMGSEIMRCARL